MYNYIVDKLLMWNTKPCNLVIFFLTVRLHFFAFVTLLRGCKTSQIAPDIWNLGMNTIKTHSNILSDRFAVLEK